MRIRQLTIATGDLEAQAAFYGERLGLPVGRDDEDGIEVRLRDSTIRFERADPGLDARYHFAINVPGDSIRRGGRSGCGNVTSRSPSTATRCEPTSAPAASTSSMPRGTWSS